MLDFIERLLSRLPKGLRSELFPLLLPLSLKVFPVWIKIKDRAAKVGSIALAAPAILAPYLYGLLDEFKANPDVLIKRLLPLWDLFQKLIQNPMVRAEAANIAVSLFDVASEQSEKAFEWLATPEASQKIEETFESLGSMAMSWLEDHEKHPPR